jgi:hypothetical protein
MRNEPDLEFSVTTSPAMKIDFEDLELDGFPSDEVKDGLRMSTIIEQPIQAQLYTSRLIAVAIIRAVAAKVADQPEAGIDAWTRWKEYLKLVFGRQRRVFRTEIDFVISDYEFQFTRDDLNRVCSVDGCL